MSYTDRHYIRIRQQASGQTEYTKIPTSGTIYEMLGDEVSTNTPFSGSSVYAGAQRVGSTHTYTTLDFPRYGDVSTATLAAHDYSGNINLRFAVKWGTSSSAISRFGYRWTGLGQTLANYWQEKTPQNLYNGLNEGTTSVPVDGAMSHIWVSFLNELKINQLICVPYFTVKTVTLSGYNNDGDDPDGNYYTRQTVSSTSYTWAQIKPEDKTPAGANYDPDLWANGYKITNQDYDSITIQFVAGVAIVPYYGNCSKLYDKSTDTYSNDPQAAITYYGRMTFNSYYADTGDFPVIDGFTGNHSWASLTVMAESYCPELNAVVYTNFPGIVWNATQVVDENTSVRGEYACNNAFTKTTQNYWNPVNLYYSNPAYGGIINITGDSAETPRVIFPGTYSAGLLDKEFGQINSNNPYYRLQIHTGRSVSFSYRKGATNNFRQFVPSYFSVFPIAELWTNLAAYGIYIADSVTAAENAPLGQNINDNNHIYLGEMLSDGTTTGVMLQGGEIADSTQAGIDDIIQGTPYVPVKPGPGGGGSDPSTPPSPSGKSEGKLTGDGTKGNKNRQFGSGSITYYALSINDAAEFKNLLWAQPKSFYNAIQIAGKQNASIFDYVSTYRYYPTDITSLGISLGAASDIHLGTGAVFKQVNGTDYKLQPLSNFYSQFSWCSWDLSSFSGWRKNFLDYSPYCKLSIYLPYAGTFDLDVQTVAAMVDITTATINVDVCIDINTGSLTYYVDADGFMILNKTLTLGIDLPLSGNDAIQQSVAILQANYHNGSQAIGMANGIAAASSDALSALTAVAQLPFQVGEMALASSLASRQIPTQVGGFGGTLSAVTMGQDPYITIYRQKIANPDNYGHAIGYLTNSRHSISELTGWTICNNPDLSGIVATTAELDMIVQLLQSGFYA